PEPYTGRVRTGHRRRRIHRAHAAARHAPIPRLHPSLRTGRVGARLRPAAGRRFRPGLRALGQPCAGVAPHQRQLPGLRGEAGMSLRGAYPALALFDLDGTLLDSAPDFVATLALLRARHGLPPIAPERIRPHVSRGARAMIKAAFPDHDEAAREVLVQPFLDIYRGELSKHGAPFEGVEAMLSALEAAGSRWGIVTNKPEALARALMPLLGWQSRCAVLVGGDTLATRKPDPQPLLHAARAVGVAVADCVHVGGDERDIVAARAAGMPSIVALWGYRLDADDPVAWQGDVMAETAGDLLDP